MAIEDWFSFEIDWDWDWSSIFSLDPIVVAATFFFYAVCMLALWKLDFVGGWQFSHKVFISVLMLPISYMMTAWQLGQG